MDGEIGYAASAAEVGPPDEEIVVDPEGTNVGSADHETLRCEETIMDSTAALTARDQQQQDCEVVKEEDEAGA